jgi:hypothetical protein
MGRLKLTHGYERYPGVPGKAHQDRRTNFGLEGDVDGTHAFTFTVDRNQLGLTTYINVPYMLNRHLSLLEGATANDMGGPFAADKANIHTIHTSSATMFIPYELVEVLLGQDFTARNVYLLSYPLLEETFMLYRLLPDLRLTNLGRLPDSFAESLSYGLTNNATEMHADCRSCETRILEATHRKTFNERYDDRITNDILLITSSVDDDFLPAFYHELGGNIKDESERVLPQRKEVHRSL